MCYQALSLSDRYSLQYTEEQHKIGDDYDFCVFNHHPWVNNWMVDSIQYFGMEKYTIVTEVGHHHHIMPMTPTIFDYYLILDPTVIDNESIFGFPRPLESIPVRKKINDDLIIGSFGFPTTGKNWEEIIIRTQLEFESATIKFHIPNATYVPNSQREIDNIIRSCNALITNPNIKIEYSHHYMDKMELIDWCSQNTINVFLYDRKNITGMSATTDQAIQAERPILVSQHPTFRHILQYLHPYPKTIKEAIDTTLPAVKQMKKDWSPIEFARKFETILFKEINGVTE